VIGKRTGYPHRSARPHNTTYVLIGGGLLWFGWFGFNAGSALAANGLAALALATTHLSAAAGGRVCHGALRHRHRHRHFRDQDGECGR
jgi:Amt family ammonium transporter